MPKGEHYLIPSIAQTDTKTHRIEGAIWTENHPYKIDTLLYIGSEKSVKKYLKKNFSISFDDSGIDFGSVDGLTVDCSRGDGSSFVLIWMPVFQWTASNIAVLTHEAIHCMVMILNMSGVHSKILDAEDQSETDDEALAHSVDYLMEQLIKKLIRKTELINQK